MTSTVTSGYTTVARGKPAEYGQEIVKRRFRLTAARLNFKNKVVLDFGCGNGAQTIEFANVGSTIVAVDIDQQDLETLSHSLQQENITTILPVQYDGTFLPVSSSSIDYVISYEVIEHVQNEAAALQELHRVLKPGGEMVLSVPNKGWIFETHGANLPLLSWNRVPFLSWLPRPIHSRIAKARIYRKRDIIQLLKNHSFEILETAYITAPMDVVKHPTIKQFLRKTFFKTDTTASPLMSTAILVHCRKK